MSIFVNPSQKKFQFLYLCRFASICLKIFFYLSISNVFHQSTFRDFSSISLSPLFCVNRYTSIDFHRSRSDNYLRSSFSNDFSLRSFTFCSSPASPLFLEIFPLSLSPLFCVNRYTSIDFHRSLSDNYLRSSFSNDFSLRSFTFCSSPASPLFLEIFPLSLSPLFCVNRYTSIDFHRSLSDNYLRSSFSNDFSLRSFTFCSSPASPRLQKFLFLRQ